MRRPVRWILKILTAPLVLVLVAIWLMPGRRRIARLIHGAINRMLVAWGVDIDYRMKYPEPPDQRLPMDRH